MRISLAKDWTQKVREEAVRQMHIAAAQAPRLGFSQEDAAANGWTEIGMEYYFTPDAGYGRDRQVEKALRRRYPDLVPIWIRWLFRSPANTGNPQVHAFGRHGLARVVTNPHHLIEPIKFEDSPPAKTPYPHKIEKIFMGPSELAMALDLPGGYVPFDSDVLTWVQGAYGELSFSELKEEFINKPREAKKTAQRKAKEELAYIQNDVNRYVAKKMEAVSEVEMKNIMMKRYFGKVEEVKKPFVHVRRTDEPV